MGFRKDFVWGAASSAYQVEGAADRDGKGDSIWDRYCREPGRILDGSDGSRACMHYTGMKKMSGIWHRWD